MRENMSELLQGIGAADGIAEGNIYTYELYAPEVPAAYGEDAAVEESRYHAAQETAMKELQNISDAMEKSASGESEIFKAHLDILSDEEINESIHDRISNQQYTAENAVNTVYTEFAALFEQMDDPLLRERRADVIDVSHRLLRILAGKKERNLACLPEPVIVAARDLLPSDTATMDRRNILGLITEFGNVTSHTAIIARNYGIPAILGVAGLMDKVEDGTAAAMDAGRGEIYLNPDASVQADFEIRRKKASEDRLLDQAFLKKELYTADGTRIPIGANIGAPNDETAKSAENVDFVGLFRTEFLYMENTHLPTEEEQFEIYKRVLEDYGSKPVTLRTIDIGGDKSIPYMDLPVEANPFLGVRALRLCYQQPELLRTQLRAALRASVFGKLEIMFPMVSSMEDIRWAKEQLSAVGAALDQEGIAWDHSLRIGIMMEVPSIMLIADKVAAEVDFASVGANDLCQYLTASDRLNPNVSRYYQSFHPANFRLIAYAVNAFKKFGKSISVCGELGGNPMGAPILIGLGIAKLSMNDASVARIKRQLSSFSMENMQALAAAVLECGTEKEVQEIVEKTLSK